MIGHQAQTPTFRSAREFFEAARAAVRDMAEAQEQLDRLDEPATDGGTGLGAHVRSSATPDAIGARVVRKVAKAERLERRIAYDELLADSAGEVIWGPSWDGFAGVASLLTDRHADVMDHYYVEALTWPETAAAMHLSVSRCRQLRNVACDCVDAYGIARVLEGTGIATDER